MLYYVGKDLMRWIEQCTEFVQRESALRASGIEWQSFAELLVEDSPLPVREKLKNWGVADYRAIFARGMGLNAVFAEVPDRTRSPMISSATTTSLRIVCSHASKPNLLSGHSGRRLRF